MVAVLACDWSLNMNTSILVSYLLRWLDPERNVAGAVLTIVWGSCVPIGYVYAINMVLHRKNIHCFKH